MEVDIGESANTSALGAAASGIGETRIVGGPSVVDSERFLCRRVTNDNPNVCFCIKFTQIVMLLRSFGGDSRPDMSFDKSASPKAIIKCLKQIQVRMNATVRNIRTDNGTEFVNQTLKGYYENVRISHQNMLRALLSKDGTVL
ncbi:integrase, catalytic region, zinc finger, CCHC-type containing protein [Tanacetum coccineum]